MRGSASTKEQLPEQRHQCNAISSVNDDASMLGVAWTREIFTILPSVRVVVVASEPVLLWWGSTYIPSSCYIPTPFNGLDA